MTKSELTYLTQQLMQTHGIDKSLINEAAQTFTSTNLEKISSLEYSEKGLTDFNKLIGEWKDSPIGQKFLPQESPNRKQLTLEEITKRIKDGSMKFQQNY